MGVLLAVVVIGIVLFLYLLIYALCKTSGDADRQSHWR